MPPRTQIPKLGRQFSSCESSLASDAIPNLQRTCCSLTIPWLSLALAVTSNFLFQFR